MIMATAFDSKVFRSALGRFATGVTVITVRDAEGKPIGVTANSFNSVSLDPPMVLWSLARTSLSMPAFMAADRFAVHVLGASQEDISNRFAARGEDKFSGLAIDPADLPLIDGCAARFICRTVHRYEGGDHVIFVGEVLEYETSELPPLLYHAGSYAEARPRLKGEAAGIDPQEGRVGANSLLNLVAQAHTQLLRPLHGWLARHGLEQPRYLILSVVSNMEEPTRAAILDRVKAVGYNQVEQVTEVMIAEGWLEEVAGLIRLTSGGKKVFADVIANLDQFERDLAEQFSPGELVDAKRVLAGIIDHTASGTPTLLG
jgi:3-hydroxy-9,10-secoandrosta-1,3,5(10)-triene-9,17-dione monooxygenase reductase component